MLAQEQYPKALAGKLDKTIFSATLKKTVRLNELLAELLGGHPDFSLYDSLEKLKAAACVNPTFEETLKNNAENNYCRSYIYENARYLYVPEMKILFTAATESLTTGAIDREQIEREYEKNRAAYFALPLEEMCPAESELKAVLTEAAALISEL